MTEYICKQCGVQFAPTSNPLQKCPICEDQRQYINWQGQQWTTLSELQAQYHNVLKAEGPQIYGIGTEPAFAIGQRALLIQTSEGNILWDCISLIDPATVQQVQALGGISAIAISHPHFYASMVSWSRAFGGVPIYLHAADQEHVMYPDPNIVFWEGDTRHLAEGLTLIRGGIHFEGGTVLHWAAGAGGRGVLLTGDIFHVVNDRRYTGFMYSYPNLIPEEPAIIHSALKRMEPFEFEQIYGAWWQRIVASDAKGALVRSAQRYLAKVGAALYQPES
jgi:hypothetical protein